VTFLGALSSLRTEAGASSLALSTVLWLPLIADHVLLGNKWVPKVVWPKRAVLVMAVLGGAFAILLCVAEVDVQNFIYFQF
jgi:hypothetical protein